MRKELDLPLDAKIETIIVAPRNHIKLLEKYKDYMASETRSDTILITTDRIVLEREEGYAKDWEIQGEQYIILIKKK